MLVCDPITSDPMMVDCSSAFILPSPFSVSLSSVSLSLCVEHRCRDAVSQFALLLRGFTWLHTR